MYTGSSPSYKERYSKNINAPAGVHIMNKNEKTALRKLKIKTGLSEQDLRKEKKYRKELSDAQTRKGDKDQYDRDIVSLIKRATSEVKLPVEHPKTKEKIKELLSINGYLRFRFYGGVPGVNAVIYRYKAIRKNRKK